MRKDWTEYTSITRRGDEIVREEWFNDEDWRQSIQAEVRTLGELKWSILTPKSTPTHAYHYGQGGGFRHINFFPRHDAKVKVYSPGWRGLLEHLNDLFWGEA